MKLTHVSFSNVGPFGSEAISFEPDVTVITGANDAGKSTLLRGLTAICARSPNETLDERDVSFDHVASARKPWTQDESISAHVKFNQEGFEAQANIHLVRDCWRNSTVHLKNHRGQLVDAVRNLPGAILLRDRNDEGVRQKLYLQDPNPTEARFLSVAFGRQMDAKALLAQSESTFLHAIARAEERLNQRLNAFLPPTLPFRFRFHSFSDKRNELIVSLVDQHEGITALGQRGSGVQKMINLLGVLATENIASTNTLLLLDEPETHLHADAQHSLRAALEQLGKLPNVQVVYATHSPSMINPLRPQSIRLLNRVARSGRVYTEVEKSSFDLGFLGVRSSLGLTPSDSLLYAPLVVIVEGKTEALCLPILLNRALDTLQQDGLTECLLSQCVFVDAEGCGNVEMLCRIAKANGARVVAFADGDTAMRWRNHLTRTHTDVQLVTLPPDREFEELVQEKMYFQALAKELNKNEDEVCRLALDQWEIENTSPKRLRFTKRIDKWLTHTFESRGLTKAPVMRLAIETSDVDSINLDPIRDLVRAMRSALERPPVIPFS